jgi:hypothetical protein
LTKVSKISNFVFYFAAYPPPPPPPILSEPDTCPLITRRQHSQNFKNNNLNIGESAMKTPKLIAIFLAAFAIMAHAQLVYTITGAGTSFTANKNGSPVSSGKPIQSVINDIKADAAGSPCTILFGSGRPGVGVQPPEMIEIGANNISFDGSGSPTWGLITLEGNITSSYNPPGSAVGPPPIAGVIYLSNGTSIESTANIANTAGTIAIESSSTAGSVTIKGGTISARGPTINGGTGTLTINGGEILAQNGRAVNKTDKIILNGGLLFGYGNKESDIINGTYTTPGSPVILGWNKQAGNTTYIAGTSDDIVISPATATAKWSNIGGYAARIDYANGANTGFIAINGVTVVNPSSSSGQTPSSSSGGSSSSIDGSSSSGEQTPIRPQQVATGKLRVQAINNAIVLENLPAGAKIEVYNLQGKCIFSSGISMPADLVKHSIDGRSNDVAGKSLNRGHRGSDNLTIPLQTKGVYIVKVSAVNLKILPIVVPYACITARTYHKMV